MVQMAGNKLIIEIDESDQAEYVQDLQREIINVIKEFDYANYGQRNGCPFFNLLTLLESTLLTYGQQVHILGLANWMRYTEPDKVKFEAWLQKSVDIIKKENE